jgi:hypothetical protein
MAVNDCKGIIQDKKNPESGYHSQTLPVSLEGAAHGAPRSNLLSTSNVMVVIIKIGYSSTGRHMGSRREQQYYTEAEI